MSGSENVDRPDPVKTKKASPIFLRVTLDQAAARSYEKMADILRAEGSVKLSPSRLISFVTCIFVNRHFEKDRETLSAEFFDSRIYVVNELKKARNTSDMEAVLAQAIVKVKKMQDLKRLGGRGQKPRGDSK